MTFGERLYQLRKENNLSQEDLAEQLNVSRQSISRWENGTASPDFNKTVLLSEILSVSTDYLIKGEEPTSVAPADKVRVLTPWRKVFSTVLLMLGGFFLFFSLYLGGSWDFYLFHILPLITCGLLCLFSKKHTLLRCLWVVYISVSNFLYTSFSWYWSHAFLLFRKIPAPLKRYILPGWFLLIALLAVVLFTARALRKTPIKNMRKHLLITGAFPIAYFLLEIFFYLWSNNILPDRLELMNSGARLFSNVMIYTARLALITAFAVYLARWIHSKRSKK